MSSKENVAINQLLALLETRYALRVLWALKDLSLIHISEPTRPY